MNDNCLDGIACPVCGSEGPFHIVATATFLVYDSGTDYFEGVDWDDSAGIACGECGETGTVGCFKGRTSAQSEDESRDETPA